MGNDVRVSSCCGAPVTGAQRLSGQMFEQCTACRQACQSVSRVQPSTDSIAADAQPAPAVLDAPETVHGKAGQISDALEGAQTPNPDQDIIACQDCAEPAEFVTFSDPPLAKCFRCAILKAMNRLCGLCGKQPVECIVRAVGENQRQDIIGICANCFSKRLSGMRN